MIKEKPYKDNKCYTSSTTSKEQSRCPHPNSHKAHSDGGKMETAENGDLRADSRNIGIITVNSFDEKNNT